jgi:hypothetical protein
LRFPPIFHFNFSFGGKFRQSICKSINPFFNVSPYKSSSIHHTPNFITKQEQHSFCTAQIIASYGVKLAYGGIAAGNRCKQKARNFSVYQEVSGFVLLKLEIYCSIGFIVGTGQGRLTNGFIFLYKPIHAASFFLLPYVTLRNSPQLTGNLV